MLPEHTPLKAKSVLIVDDEPTNLSVMCRMLDIYGYDIHTFAFPSDALAFMHHHHDVDLLVTDLAMPEIKGEVLACKAIEEIPNIKVMFVTGLGSDVHQVRDNGHLGKILYKPFSIAKFRSVVSAMFDGSDG